MINVLSELQPFADAKIIPIASYIPFSNHAGEDVSAHWDATENICTTHNAYARRYDSRTGNSVRPPGRIGNGRGKKFQIVLMSFANYRFPHERESTCAGTFRFISRPINNYAIGRHRRRFSGVKASLNN